MLDGGPLGRLCHPKGKSPLNDEIADWLEDHLSAGSEIIVPEITDYELRRELLRAKRAHGIEHLERLKQMLIYQPLTTVTMLRAAELWAQARNRGAPTAPPEALDVDVILAAQAELAGATVATENVGHLSLFVPAMHWRDLPAHAGG
jgi:predicted nucleic acid-binding protein